MDTIRLMLVDDHEVVRAGLRSFLNAQTGMQVIGEASSGEEALELGPKICPDVIVMDITMPAMDGMEATRRLRVSCAHAKILVLTVHEDKQYFFEMLAAGALGYVSKQSAAEELVAAIRTVAQGLVYLQPALARWLLEDYRRLLIEYQPDTGGFEAPEERQPGLDELSKRERQVVELVAEGLTSNEVGEQLGISPKTVARHRERIMHKLNLHSSTELVKFAIRTGLIDVR
ncbi:MAG TPA: response regulator transcription factor [Anaerolineales bacterium]|nr:response regulator transcription factor [Anaerolineales bacterium]